MSSLIDAITGQPAAATAWAAVLALIVASGSLIATIITLVVQRDHNRKSVAPVAQFSLGDYETCIEVALENKGQGPLRIEQIIVSGGGQDSDRLISLMPRLPDSLSWTTFTGNISSRWLSAGERISILRLDGSDTDAMFCIFRDRVRRALGPLCIEVRYSDVYSKHHTPHRRSLDWFLRNLASEA